MAAFARIGFCLLLRQTFRPWTIAQPLLLPPSVQDFVGEDHLARFILALVSSLSTLVRSKPRRPATRVAPA